MSVNQRINVRRAPVSSGIQSDCFIIRLTPVSRAALSNSSFPSLFAKPEMP